LHFIWAVIDDVTGPFGASSSTGEGGGLGSRKDADPDIATEAARAFNAEGNNGLA